jgi:hypothetical protein
MRPSQEMREQHDKGNFLELLGTDMDRNFAHGVLDGLKKD